MSKPNVNKNKPLLKRVVGISHAIQLIVLSDPLFT